MIGKGDYKLCPDIVFTDNVLGEARFAGEGEIKKAGLSGNNGGFVFGRIRNYLVEKSSDVEGHCLIVGAPGTGKSSCIAIPTLSRWKGSVFVIDIKGELSAATADLRNRDAAVYIFDPEDKNCSRYNPLEMCNTVDGAQDFARALIPVPASGDPYWAQSAQAVLSAGAYQAAMTGEKFSVMIERLCITPTEKLIEEFQGSEYKAVRLLSSILVGTPEKTLGGVMSELKTKVLQFGADEHIESATSGSDWSPETLEEGASIYIRISERMISQYEGLWTVIISQITRYLMGRKDGQNPPILLLLDEFPRLGKVPKILEALSTLRSRNVHIALFIQSMAQLDYTYSSNERKIIADNCSYKLVFSASDPETQKYFSDLGGYKTVWSGSQSSGKGTSTAGAPIVGSSSWNSGKSLSQSSVPLIRPEEFSKLDYPVVFCRNLHPFKIVKAFYKSDPVVAPAFGFKAVGSAKETPMEIEKKNTGLKNKWVRISLWIVILSVVFSYFALSYVAIGAEEFVQDAVKKGEITKEVYVKYIKAISELNDNKFLAYKLFVVDYKFFVVGYICIFVTVAMNMYSTVAFLWGIGAFFRWIYKT